LASHEVLLRGAGSNWEKQQPISQDLLKHWDALWTLSRRDGLEPTNNRAERGLRPAVIWRKSCYGTQSVLGSRFVERMLSVRATCAQQGRNLFAFLTEAVQAAWSGQPVSALFCIPSTVTTGPMRPNMAFQSDRFARDHAFLKSSRAARSRRLNARALGGASKPYQMSSCDLVYSADHRI
jgi:hypothetical protein